jgi:hypothetical protein
MVQAGSLQICFDGLPGDACQNRRHKTAGGDFSYFQAQTIESSAVSQVRCPGLLANRIGGVLRREDGCSSVGEPENGMPETLSRIAGVMSATLVKLSPIR